LANFHKEDLNLFAIRQQIYFLILEVAVFSYFT